MLQIKNKDNLLICRRNELCEGKNPPTGTGVRGYLDFTDLPDHWHPDCIYEGWDSARGYYGRSKTAGYYEEIYGIGILEEGSSDLILSPRAHIKRLCVSIEDGLWKRSAPQIMAALDAWEHSAKVTILDRLNRWCDLAHSLANMSPAPYGFNGYRRHDGKGSCIDSGDLDFPDLFIKRATSDLPVMHQWIMSNMDKLCLSPMYRTFDSGYKSVAEARRPIDFSNPDDVAKFITSIEAAISAIEQRGNLLYSKQLQRGDLCQDF